MPGPFRSRWNRGGERLSGPQPKTFPTSEPNLSGAAAETGMVKGPASFGPKLILHPWRARLSGGVQEIVVCIEDAIPHVLIDGAMKEIRSTLGPQVGHSAGKVAPFCTQ